MKSRIRIGWMILPVLVLGISAWWILRSLEEPRSSLLKTRVIRGDIRQVVRGFGSLEADEVEPIQAQLSGSMKRIHVKAGQEVEKGDLLFEIRSQDFKKDYLLTKAKYAQGRLELKKMLAMPDPAAVFEAQGALDKARRLARDLDKELQDRLELHQKGFVSNKEMEELQGRVENAHLEEKIAEKRWEDVSTPPPPEEVRLKKAELSKMKAQVKALRDQWRARRVRATARSLVVEVLKKEGDSVKPEETVLTLVNTDRPFVIRGMVYEGDVGKIVKGQKAFVKLSGSLGPLQAEVMEVSLVAKSMGQSRKFPIMLLVHDKIEGPVRLGIGADYEILIDERRQVLALPVQFVVHKAGPRRDVGGAWLMREGKMEFINLKLGLSDDNLVEIIDGIQEGREVVLPDTRDPI